MGGIPCECLGVGGIACVCVCVFMPTHMQWACLMCWFWYISKARLMRILQNSRGRGGGGVIARRGGVSALIGIHSSQTRLLPKRNEVLTKLQHVSCCVVGLCETLSSEAFY